MLLKKVMSNDGINYKWVIENPEQTDLQSLEEKASVEEEARKERYRSLADAHQKGLSALKALKESIDFLEDADIIIDNGQVFNAKFEVSDSAGLSQKEFIKLKAAHYELYKYVVKIKEKLDDLKKEETK